MERTGERADPGQRNVVNRAASDSRADRLASGVRARRAAVLPGLLLALMGVPGTLAGQLPGPLVTGDWLEQRLGDPGLVVIHTDSRRDGYDRAHIPGAVFLATSEIVVPGDPAVDYEIPPADQLVRVLGAAGITDASTVVITADNPLAATRLWLTLDWLGHGDRTALLDGLQPRWQAEGRPLSDAPAPPAGPGGTLTPRPRADMIVQAEWILARLEDPGTVLLDARPTEEYTGEDGGMGGMANPGHIPGAWHLYWVDRILDRRTDPSFLPVEQLRARFEAAGAAPDRTVVTYCMIGARASLTYFVGRMLGYEMKFYDGSWHDWGTRDLPWVRGPSRR